MYKIITEANQIIANYDNHSLEIMSGLEFHQSQILKMIEFYSNSRYLKGNVDELDKEKPFYNIVNAICDVENAAVDIDTKDIQVTSDLPQNVDKSFVLTIELQEWMKQSNFAFTLNELRDTRTRYGGVLAKKCIVEKDGEKKLSIEVPEWKNLVTDPIDLINGVIIEKHYMSPSELSKKQDSWENVPDAIKLATKTREENDKKKTATSKRVPIFEIRGEFPLSYYKEVKGEVASPEDEFKYTYQLYIIAGEDEGTQILLYCEEDTERVYKYLPRKKKSGRALGLGVIEENEQSQVWVNDAVQKQQRAVEYTSKIIGQSASKKLKGRNLVTEADNGVVLEHEDGKPITRVELSPSGGLAQFDNLIAQWYNNAEKTSSTYAAQRGETPPSGTPYRLQAAILNQSSSVFDNLREEFGIFVGEIFYDWVLPFESSRLNKKHILSHQFGADELKALDDSYSNDEANKKTIEKILGGEIATMEEYAQYKQFAFEAVQQSKAHRFLDIPKDYYKDLDAKVTVNTTGEQRNKAAVLESLNNLLLSIGQNPALLTDPVAQQLFMRIVEISGSGISPISLISAIQEQKAALPPPQQQPQPQPMSLEANPA